MVKLSNTPDSLRFGMPGVGVCMSVRDCRGHGYDGRGATLILNIEYLKLFFYLINNF